MQLDFLELRGSSHEHVGHLCEVGPHRVARDVLAQPPDDRRDPAGVPGRCRRGEPAAGAGSGPRRRSPACRDRREDADVRRGERVREAVLELRDSGDFGPRREAQLVAAHVRADHGADDLGVDAEAGERLEQRAADRLAVARVGFDRSRRARAPPGRAAVADLVGLGDPLLAALLAWGRAPPRSPRRALQRRCLASSSDGAGALIASSKLIAWGSLLLFVAGSATGSAQPALHLVIGLGAEEHCGDRLGRRHPRRDHLGVGFLGVGRPTHPGTRLARRSRGPLRRRGPGPLRASWCESSPRSLLLSSSRPATSSSTAIMWAPIRWNNVADAQ